MFLSTYKLEVIKFYAETSYSWLLALLDITPVLL